MVLPGRPVGNGVRIPTMPITDTDLMPITIPSGADRRRSEATLGSSNDAELIGIRQCLCPLSGEGGAGRAGTAESRASRRRAASAATPYPSIFISLARNAAP